MSAVNNDSSPIYLPPAQVKEVKNAKRLDTLAKVGLISLGVVLIAGTAFAIAVSVKGFQMLDKANKLNFYSWHYDANFNYLSNAGAAMGITGLLGGIFIPVAAGISIFAATKIIKTKEKIREMVKREELTDAQRFELYRRNQHHFTPREFYLEALQKVLRDAWNINNGEVDLLSGQKNLKSFEQSVKQFIADNATAPEHADADTVVNDVLRSQMLEKQNVIGSARELLEAFGKEAKAVTSPIPMQYLEYFWHLETIPFAPKQMKELKALEGEPQEEGKEIHLKVDFMNCKDREFTEVKSLARVKKVEAVHIKNLTVAYDLIARCPKAEEAIVEVPFAQTQDNLRAFCNMVAKLPHCPKKLTLVIPKGHMGLTPRDIVYPNAENVAKVTQTSNDTHDTYTYMLADRAIAE